MIAEKTEEKALLMRSQLELWVDLMSVVLRALLSPRKYLILLLNFFSREQIRCELCRLDVNCVIAHVGYISHVGWSPDYGG